MKKITTYLLAASMLALASCSKDDDNNANNNNPGPQLTKKQMISAKSWNITGIAISGVDAWPQVPACNKDDIFTFKADGTYIQDEGATKCDPSDPQTETATWAFVDNETRLAYDGDTVKINELTASKMVLENTIQGNKTVATFTAK